MEWYRNLDQSGSCTITCQMQKFNTFCYHKYDAVDKLITKHLKCSGYVITLLELYRSLRFMVLFSRCKVRILCTCANQSTVCANQQKAKLSARERALLQTGLSDRRGELIRPRNQNWQSDLTNVLFFSILSWDIIIQFEQKHIVTFEGNSNPW